MANNEKKQHGVIARHVSVVWTRVIAIGKKKDPMTFLNDGVARVPAVYACIFYRIGMFAPSGNVHTHIYCCKRWDKGDGLAIQ